MDISGEYSLSEHEYLSAAKVLKARYRFLGEALAAVFGVAGVLLLIHGDAGFGAYCLLLVPARFMRSRGRIPTTAVFTDQTFATRSELSSVEVPWQSMAKAVQTPEVFLLYNHQRYAVIVPKSAFSDADVAGIRSLLRGESLI